MTRTVGPVTGAASVGAACGVILVYVVETTTGLDLPTLVEGSITVLLTGLGGYLVPAKKGDHAAD